MPRSVASLAVSVTANTRGLARGLERGRKYVKQFTFDVNAMSTMLRRVGAGAILNPITALAAGIAGTGVALVKAARQAEEFNRAMRNSQAIMGQLNTLIDEDMRRAAFDVARYTQFSATEAAKAYYFLASAGLDAKQSIGALPLVAQFAQAGMFDLALATDLLTDAQSSLGLKVDDTAQNMENMKRVGDVLVKANTLANASVQQFAEALTNKAGPAMKAVGMQIEEGVGVLAAFADQGIKAAEAGTAFHIVLRELQRRAIENAGAFRQFGIRVFDAAGELRYVPDIVRELERALAGASDETKKMTLATLGFQDKSIAYMQALLGTSGAMDTYIQGLRESGDTMKRVAEDQLTPFQKGWAKLKGSISETTQALQGTTDAAGTALGALGGWLDKYVDAFNKLATGGVSKQLETSQEVQKWLEAMLERRKQVAEEDKGIAEDVAQDQEAAAKRLKDIEDILTGLHKQLEETKNLGPLWDLRELNATAEQLAEARDLISRAAAVEDITALDELIRGLERESELFGKSARELDLLEAGWKGATEQQLEYINNLHDMIDAARTQADQEREAKAAAARHADRLNRVTQFVEIDVSRTLVSGLAAARRQKQKVQDEDALRELRLIRQNTGRGNAAIVGPG